MTKVFIDLEAFEFESRNETFDIFSNYSEKKEMLLLGMVMEKGVYRTLTNFFDIAFCKNSWHLFLKCFRKKLRHGFLTLC